MTRQANIDWSELCPRRRCGRSVRTLSNGPLQKLVASLNAVHEGKLAIPLLFIAGERAIRPLRDILLHGSVDGSGIRGPQVVWALAELGARAVLFEYLANPRYFRDPDLQQAEEATRETAVLALRAWRDKSRCPMEEQRRS